MEKSRHSISHNKWQSVDEIAGETFQNIGSRIEASGELKRQIDCRIMESAKKEEHSMKHFSIKKVVIGVAAACLIVGTIGIAGSGIKSYVGGSSAIPDYTKFADLEKAQKEVGYTADAVEKFENGFAMQGIHIGDIAIMNEADQKEAAQKEIIIDYKKDSESIMYCARRLFASEDSTIISGKTSDKTLQVGETTAAFTQITNKFVPPDYELTAEDEENMKNPNYNLAYGSAEVETNTGYSVSWVKDGNIYSLYGTDLSISSDEMLNMAKEIIESGRE